LFSYSLYISTGYYILFLVFWKLKVSLQMYLFSQMLDTNRLAENYEKILFCNNVWPNFLIDTKHDCNKSLINQKAELMKNILLNAAELRKY
jgi:hypothetical protein